MKKITCIIVALLMIISLAACGGNNAQSPTSQTADSKPETTAGQSQTSASDEKETSSAKEEETTTEETTAEETTTADLQLDFSATIEETVLVDDMGVKITATELSYNSYEAQLSVTIENNTDKDLDFLSGTLGYPRVFVNGYMVTGGYLNEEVAAGMTADETIEFSLDELALYGMKDIAEIGIGFEIEEGYDEYFKPEIAVIKTSADPDFDYNEDLFVKSMKDGALLSLYGASLDYASEETIFDESGVSVVNQYVGTNKDGERLMFMEVRNDSDKDVAASISNIAVNDLVVTSGTWTSDYIIAGKKAVMSVNINDAVEQEYLDVLGLENYGKIGFMFKLLEDNYYTEISSKQIDIALEGGNSSAPSGDVIYNDNNISIMYAGLIKDPHSYSNDIHALFILNNGNDYRISIDDKDSVYVDKKKVDSTLYTFYVQPGNTVLLDVEIDGNDFEKNGFEIDNVSEITFGIEINDDHYNVIDEPSLTITVSK